MKKGRTGFLCGLRQSACASSLLRRRREDQIELLTRLDLTQQRRVCDMQGQLPRRRELRVGIVIVAAVSRIRFRSDCVHRNPVAARKPLDLTHLHFGAHGGGHSVFSFFQYREPPGTD